MSKNIVNDHPFTEDEIAYLKARNRFSEIAANEKDFPPGLEPVVPEVVSTPPVLNLDQDIFELVNGIEDEELKEKLTELKIKPKGDTRALKVALAQALQEARDKEK